jgi:hypothetical protein
MNIIDLTQQHVDIFQALELAHDGPLVLIAPDGREYVLAEADDFDREVELLRSSAAFQQFLDARLATKHHRRPLADVLHDVEAEIAREQADAASTE